MNPFFSIIIPTLNEEKYLPKLLTQLLKQIERNFEVIIVDGASEDKTKEEAFKFKDSLNLSFFENERKNVSYQRNFGAYKARGEYLIFLDADAGVVPSFTKNLKKIILKKKGLVFIPTIIPDENSPQVQLVFRIANFLVETSHNTGKPFSNGGNMFWESNFFKEVGGFDVKLYIAEDHNIVQRAYQWGVRAKFLRQIKVEFSLRRSKTEGELTYFYKYLIATAHLLLKGDIKKKIFEYEMGGKNYSNLKNNVSFEDNIRNYLKQLKNFFEQYLT